MLAVTSRPSVVVVMPAYNAARTLAATWQAIPVNAVDEVILVDDGSVDATLDVAAKLPIRTLPLPHNVGYGGNQKTCYLEALRIGADIVVMLHPDGQYNPALIPEMVAPIAGGEADMVLGSRLLIPGGARAGGMPLYRYVSNRVLTTIENRALGTSFSELHTGYRAYNRKFLETVPFLRNSNDFVFDTQVLVQAARFGFGVAEIPAVGRYFKEASSVGFQTSVVYGLKTLLALATYLANRMGFPCRWLDRPLIVSDQQKQRQAA